MTYPEPNIRIDVDVTNPGQFFACCGLLELADRLWPGAEGWFEERQFRIMGSLNSQPDLRMLLARLSEAHAEPLVGSSDAKLSPVQIGTPFNFRLDWWLDTCGEKTLFGKMFSGQKRTLKDVTRLQGSLSEALRRDHDDTSLLDWNAPLKGRFGVDPRAGWKALDVGFSPNEQGMAVGTYLVTELVGAIGLQASPPKEHGDTYLYAPWFRPLSACVSRAAAAGLIPGIGDSLYSFGLTKRGGYKGFDFATPIGDES